MEFLYSWVTKLYICIAQLENTPIKSMLYKFVKIQPQEYYPDFGQRILYQERGGSPCVSGIEHKSRIICHLTDASDTSDAKSSDTQIDDDNGRSHGGGGWSLKLGLSDASQASDANLGDWMTDTS